MKLVRQLVAVLTLVAWVCAGAHVVLEHGGNAFGISVIEAAHADHHDHDTTHHHHHGDGDEPGPIDQEDHHHDIGAIVGGQLAKSEWQAIAREWVRADAEFVAQLSAMLRTIEGRREDSVLEHSPPDSRASGWLLVVQTARPVRGPSLS